MSKRPYGASLMGKGRRSEFGRVPDSDQQAPDEGGIDQNENQPPVHGQSLHERDRLGRSRPHSLTIGFSG